MNAGYSSSVYQTPERTKPRRTEEGNTLSQNHRTVVAATKQKTLQVQVKDQKLNQNRTH